jgi:hypothetical protein
MAYYLCLLQNRLKSAQHLQLRVISCTRLAAFDLTGDNAYIESPRSPRTGLPLVHPLALLALVRFPDGLLGDPLLL